MFTGGSLLYGSVGRPDLISPAATEGLANDQWRSVQRLVTEFGADAAVFPTHGLDRSAAPPPRSAWVDRRSTGCE